MTGIDLIAAERQRQIDVEGWTPAHDDHHREGEMTRSAICYADYAIGRVLGAPHLAHLPTRWPWSADWWKPSVDPVRNLVKAGALIAAEIDRLRRLEANHS